MSPKIDISGNPLRGFTWAIKDADGSWLTSRSKNFPTKADAALDARDHQLKVARAELEDGLSGSAPNQPNAETALDDPVSPDHLRRSLLRIEGGPVSIAQLAAALVTGWKSNPSGQSTSGGCNRFRIIP